LKLDLLKPRKWQLNAVQVKKALQTVEVPTDVEEIVVLKGVVEGTEKGLGLDLLEEGREEMRTVGENEEVNQVIKGPDHLAANGKVELDQAPVVPVHLPAVAPVALAQVAVHPPVPIRQGQGHGIRKNPEINQEKKNQKNRKVSPKTGKVNILKARTI